MLCQKTPRPGLPTMERGVFLMSRKPETDMHRLVFSLDGFSFEMLKAEVARRESLEELGAYELEDLALKYGRAPKCPRCGSRDFTLQGRDGGERRYECSECGKGYRLLSGTVFASSRLEPPKFLAMCRMMTYNVPLDMIAEELKIHHNTALLWRRKAFATVAAAQDRVRLSGVVWFDEIYTFDWLQPRDHFHKGKRGLSKRKISIILAVDQYKNMVLFAAGRGTPTSQRVLDCLGPHVSPKARELIHDGLMAHRRLVEALGIPDQVYKSTVKDEASLRAMLLINSFSSWVKRFLSRFTGMRTDEYLQDYLNWFVYVFRVKKSAEEYPKNERILRHLLLADAEYTRRGR